MADSAGSDKSRHRGRHCDYGRAWSKEGFVVSAAEIAGYIGARLSDILALQLPFGVTVGGLVALQAGALVVAVALKHLFGRHDV